MLFSKDIFNSNWISFIGALYANNNGLEKAIEDFEAALKVDPKHTNGRKYMCETLVAVARNYEDDKKVPTYEYLHMIKRKA